MVGVVEHRQSIPILSNVLLKVTENSLILTTSNLEVELSEVVSLEEVVEEGSVTAPAHKLLDIARVASPNSSIRLELQGAKLCIQCENSRFIVMTLPAKDYPNIQYNHNNIEFISTQKEFHFLLQQVYFAMAQQDVRYYLNGMLLEVTPKYIRSVATDGHRLAMCTLMKNFTEVTNQCIIPRKSVIELLKLLSNGDTPLKVNFSDNHLKIETNNVSFVSKLIDAKFPNYETVLPRGGDKVIALNVDLFKKILNRTSIMTSKKYHGIKFVLRPSKLLVMARNSEQEEATDEIDVDYQGGNLDIAFNFIYFKEALSEFPSEEVRITFSGNNNSALLEPVLKNEGDYVCFYVIMPMRL
jgi:DNA polymerase-3 subunit beta